MTPINEDNYYLYNSSGEDLINNQFPNIYKTAEELTQAIAFELSYEKCKKLINLHIDNKSREILGHLYSFLHSVVCHDQYQAQIDIIPLVDNIQGRELLLSILNQSLFCIDGVDQKLTLRQLVLHRGMDGIDNCLPIDDVDHSEGDNIKINTSSNRRSRSPQTRENISFSAIGKNVISTKEKKMDKSFGKVIKSLLKEPEGRVTILYTYPLYTTDESLFKFLRTLLPKMERYVHHFLSALSKHLFPHGVSPIIDAKESYQSLLSDLKIDEPALQIKALKERLALENIPELCPKEPITIRWSDLSSEAIVKGLSQRDALLFRLTNVATIGEYLESGKDPTSIQTTRVFFLTTALEIAYQIVCKVDNAMQREVEILKFVDIGHSFLMKKNYNGAMQVSAALNHPAVRRLWESNKEICAECQNLIDQCNKDYSNPFNWKVLPYESSIYQSLQKTYVDMKDEKIKFATGLKDLAEKIRLLKNGRLMCSNLGIKAEKLRIIQFLSSSKNVTEEALLEYSYLCCDQERFYTKDLPKHLHEWNATDLAQFISQFGDRKEIKALLDQGVFTGNILIHELDKDKHFMDEWSYDIRVGFAELYAKHRTLSFGQQ